MLAIALYFVFGYFVFEYSKPIHFAGGYAITVSLSALMFGYHMDSALFTGAILFVYSAFTYMVVNRYRNALLVPIGVLIAGAGVMAGVAYVA